MVSAFDDDGDEIIITGQSFQDKASFLSFCLGTVVTPNIACGFVDNPSSCLTS
jgi:hypothetical protein